MKMHDKKQPIKFRKRKQSSLFDACLVGASTAKELTITANSN